MLRFLGRLLGGFSLIAAFGVSPSSALVINTIFVPPGQFVPGTSVRMGTPSPVQAGGGTLESVVRAAADYWEDIIDEPGTLFLRFGWGALGTSVLAQTLGVGFGGGTIATGIIQFTNRSTLPWFVDPTPTDNSEFGALQATSQDFGAGPVNIGLHYTGGTGDAGESDMFSTALHEIEHALGFGGITIAIGRDLTITDPLPFAGTTVPLTSDLSHFQFAGPLMSTSLGPAERELPSDIDILGLAEVNGWTDVTLNDIAVAEEPASIALVLLGLTYGATMRRRRSPARWLRAKERDPQFRADFPCRSFGP